MIDDLQKASIFKRASAWLFDLIMLCILTVGVASLLSLAMNYDRSLDELDAYYAKYEQQFGVDFDISSEEYEKLTQEQLKLYEDAFAAMNADEGAVLSYNKVMNSTLLMVTLSILSAYLILEFFVPMFLHNGQTLGKKIFAIGLMRIDSVQVSNIQLFIRTVLGKFTIETMVPVLIAIMIIFNSIGIIGAVILLGIALLQIIMMIATETNSAIHDRLANTVVIDLPSQMIFESEEAMLEFKKQRHKEMAENRPY